MKYKKDWKIELCYDDGGFTTQMRYYYWRVKPCELNMFQRVFSNGWNLIELECCAYWNPCIDVDDYYKYIEPLKTYGDIVRLRDSEWKKIQENRKELIDGGFVFPDEYD